MNFQRFIQYRQQFCKHHNGCIYDAVLQAFKQIKYGAIISIILQTIKSAKALLKSVKQFKTSFNPNFFSIVLFLVASTLTLRLVKCGLRLLRGRDQKIDSFFAGVAAGWVGTMTLDRKYWYLLLMFIASRLMGAFYQFLVYKKYVNPKKNVFHYYLIFSIANLVHCYGYFIEPDILKSDMYNIYQKMSVLTNNEKKWHRSSLLYSLRTLKQQKVDFFDNTIQQKINKLTKQIQK